MARTSPHPNPEAYGSQPRHVFAQNCQTIREAGRLNLIDHRHSAETSRACSWTIHRNTGERGGKIAIGLMGEPINAPLEISIRFIRGQKGDKKDSRLSLDLKESTYFLNTRRSSVFCIC